MTFSVLVEKYLPTLEKYTLLLFRIHGAHHRKLEQVRDIFTVMNAKGKKMG